jgi:ubiquitin-conjugating enzyme E2 Q
LHSVIANIDTDPETYPRRVSYIVFTISEAPENIRGIFEDMTTSTSGMTIGQLLDAITHRICATLNPSESHEAEDQDGDEDNASHLASSDSEDNEMDMPYDSDHGEFGAPEVLGHRMSPLVLERIQQDLRACKDAGFRVGRIYGADESSNYGLVSVSIKASKLGISDETRIAWNLDGPGYVVLLMKYDGGYTLAEDIIQGKANRLCRLQFKLRKCSRYRPMSDQARAAFSPEYNSKRSDEQAFGKDQKNPGDDAADGELSTFGADGFIDLLLNNEFLAMMKIRKRKWNRGLGHLP